MYVIGRGVWKETQKNGDLRGPRTEVKKCKNWLLLLIQHDPTNSVRHLDTYLGLVNPNPDHDPQFLLHKWIADGSISQLNEF